MDKTCYERVVSGNAKKVQTHGRDVKEKFHYDMLKKCVILTYLIVCINGGDEKAVGGKVQAICKLTAASVYRWYLEPKN